MAPIANVVTSELWQSSMFRSTYLLLVLAELNHSVLCIVSVMESEIAKCGMRTLYCRLSSSSNMEILIPFGVCAV